MNQYEDIVIVGFDLGHGEFSLATLAMIASDGVEPQSIEINGYKSQVTAVAYSPKKKLWIGKQAMRADATQIEISFKTRPPMGEHSEKIIQDFCTGVYDYLKEQNQIQKNRKYQFFVGCPSGWSEAEKAQYEKIIAKSSLINVTVVRESRAAFMHAKKKCEFKNQELANGVLVIDIGSSTTDFTYVVNDQDNPFDAGGDLGGGLIDCAIFDLTLSKHPEKQKLEEAFKQNSSLKRRAKYTCRLSKEAYFSEPDHFDEQPEVIVPIFENLQGIVINPLVTSNTMQTILHKKLSELRGMSWIEAYRNKLNQVKEQIKSKGFSVKKILITGGAAKMKFTRKICSEIFPESDPPIPGNEPELTVAKGLALWGRISIRTEDFRKDADEIVERLLTRIVESRISELTDSLATTLSSGVVYDIVYPNLQKWNTKQISNSIDLQNAVNSEIQQWFNKPCAKDLTIKQVNEYSKKVQEEINKNLNPICEKYGLKKDVFKIIKFKFPSIVEDKLSPNFSKQSIEYTYTYSDYKNAGWGLVVGSGLGAGLGAGAGAGTAFLLGVAAGGPIAWTALGIGVLGGIIGAAAGTEEKTGKAEHKVLTEEQIKNIVDSEFIKLQEMIKKAYDCDNEHIRTSLSKEIILMLNKALKESIDRARFLIP